MTSLVVKFFPLCAVLFSAFACVFPATLDHLGFLIVPLLGFIMLGMGATLSVSDFINFKSELNGLFTEIFNKNETFKPCEDVKNCEYCNFKLLCNRK